MAKIFYYDVGTADATVQAGTTGGGTTFTLNDAALTNETLANDQSISGAVTAWIADDAIRFQFDSSISATMVAIYFNASEGDNLDIYAGDHGTDMTRDQAKLVAHTAPLSAGWNIIDLGGTKSGRYWFIVANGGSGLAGLTEIFVGNKYTFATNPELSKSESKRHGIDVDRNYGGVKGTNKRFDELKTWNWTWPTVAEADRTNLETFENAIDVVRLKFIYDDETTKWWVSKTNTFVFTDVAFGYYSVSINLVEEVE